MFFITQSNIMKLQDIPYQQISIEEFETEWNALLQQMEQAATFEKQEAIISKLYQKREDFLTMYELAGIRYSQDTRNEELRKNRDYADEAFPQYENWVNNFYITLNKSPFKKEITEKWGSYLLDISKFSTTNFSPDIIKESQIENKLMTQYSQIRGKANIEFNGETFNLSGIRKYTQDSDRKVREAAFKKRWAFFDERQTEFDDLFDQMVKVRHQMAQKLGYKNYVELSYRKMLRMDFDDKMVANFRKQIAEEIVPITRQLRKRQKARLGYDELQLFDLNFQFLSGNPKPKEGQKGILQHAQKMYQELSTETHRFFDYMLEYGLMDVMSRPGKEDGGYAYEISKYKHPFIFANFNGTSKDIDVLTHEVGHAFQYFQCRDYEVIEYRTSNHESSEIHSMAMELLAYPWMEGFFKEDTEKYYYYHLSDSLFHLPFGCAIDHFQHIIYQNPEYTPDQRAEVWLQMEELYLPDYDSSLTPALKNGRFWQHIPHIFGFPMMYIEYILAQICAYQFWKKAKEDKKSAWQDYLNLCNAGGTKPFLELLKVANLQSPFEDGTVKNVTGIIIDHLDSIDDSQF